MPTVKTHQLAEVISCKLFSIETVPKKEQRKMVNRCIKSACQHHDDIVEKLKKEIVELKDEVVKKTKWYEIY